MVTRCTSTEGPGEGMESTKLKEREKNIQTYFSTKPQILRKGTDHYFMNLSPLSAGCGVSLTKERK